MFRILYKWINPISKYQRSTRLPTGTVVCMSPQKHKRWKAALSLHHLCRRWCLFKLLHNMVGFGPSWPSFEKPLLRMFPGPHRSWDKYLVKRTLRSLLSCSHCSQTLWLFEPTHLFPTFQVFQHSRVTAISTLCDYEEIRNDTSTNQFATNLCIKTWKEDGNKMQQAHATHP